MHYTKTKMHSLCIDCYHNTTVWRARDKKPIHLKIKNVATILNFIKQLFYIVFHIKSSALLIISKFIWA